MSRAKGYIKIGYAVEDLAEAVEQIGVYDFESQNKMEQAFASSLKDIRDSARQRVAIGTGKLRRSIKTKFDKASWIGEVRARGRHAHLVEGGAKKTIVKPKKKKALKADGFGTRRFFSKAVIPARRARPYMIPAFEEVKPKFTKRIKDAVKR
jgi:hypothetical protein|nr:MAG TPA: Minor capsid protein [Caudoviricetes sp.]